MALHFDLNFASQVICQAGVAMKGLHLVGDIVLELVNIVQSNDVSPKICNLDFLGVRVMDL